MISVHSILKRMKGRGGSIKMRFLGMMCIFCVLTSTLSAQLSEQEKSIQSLLETFEEWLKTASGDEVTRATYLLSEQLVDVAAKRLQCVDMSLLRGLHGFLISRPELVRRIFSRALILNGDVTMEEGQTSSPSPK